MILQFSNVTPTGYTVTRQDGSTEVYTGKLYNGLNSTCHIFRENNVLYEVFPDRFLARSDKVCTFVRLIESDEWLIEHNFNAAVIIHVLRHDGLVLYPKKILLLDYNTVKLTYDTVIKGQAIVRVI